VALLKVGDYNSYVNNNAAPIDRSGHDTQEEYDTIVARLKAHHGTVWDVTFSAGWLIWANDIVKVIKQCRKAGGNFDLDAIIGVIAEPCPQRYVHLLNPKVPNNFFQQQMQRQEGGLAFASNFKNKLVNLKKSSRCCRGRFSIFD
jgi:hypothetical protein